MAIQLYGTVQSRALRCMWCLEEVGVDWELVKTRFMGDSKKPEYLALNPNGRVPTLVDGDLVLWESMAINLYLAKKYGGELWPASEADQARAIQWSFWGINEIEPHVMALLIHRMMLPEDKRNTRVADEAERDVDRPLAVLEAWLESREHLLGGAFGIADLNVASVLAMAGLVGIDLSGYPKVQAWLARCTGRPAMAKAQAAEG
jgi:glutathione S-transferase